MPPVPHDDPNDVPLRDYIERLFVEHQRAHTVEHASIEEARREAADDIKRRLGELNQLRSEVVQDRAQFLRSDVYDQKHDALQARVTKLEQQSIKDGELHATVVPSYRVTETAVDELQARVDKLEESARRSKESATKTERQRKWLLGLTVTVILAVLAIATNVIINLTQGGVP